MTSEYKIITASSASELTKKVNELMNENNVTTRWMPDGTHNVVETHRQNRYSGSQLKDTVITVEYSQTMKKNNF